MRKLATACMSGATAVFLSFYLLPLTIVLPAALVCTGLAVLFFFFRKKGDSAQRLFLCVIGTAIGFGVFSLHWNATIRYAEIWDGEEQTLHVRLMEVPEKQNHYVRLHVKRTETPKLDIMLYDYSGDLSDMKPGELLLVTAKLRRADLRYGERSNSYISRNIYLTGTVRSIIQTGRSRQSLETIAAGWSHRLSSFTEQFFPGRVAVFMRALMLGDKTDFYQDAGLYARMRGAGFMHIVAVSGMHIAFLVGMIQLLFGASPASSAAGLILVWFFVLITGAPPSAVRAGIMQSILLMAPVFRRENDGITSLLAALALILLANPFACGSISLQMSFSAMAGMILLAEPLTRFMTEAFGLRPRGVGEGALSVLAASLAVLICSAPLTVIHFGSLAIYSPVTNLLGLWAVSLCFCGGWLTCLIGLFVPKLGMIAAVFPTLLAKYLFAVAGLVSRMPHHMISMQRAEMKLWLLMCYLLVLIAWRSVGSKRFRVLLPLGLCILTLAVSLWSTKLRYRSADEIVAALDVGQGECVCVISDDTTLMLDCGGLGTLNNAGETAADWLDGAGRSCVDMLILSHLHEDHCNGVAMLLELVPVKQIILSPDSDSDENMLLEIQEAAEEHGTEVVLLEEDRNLQLENLTVSLFAPPEDATENERCIMSLVSIGEYDLIFTGDSPKKAELRLIENHVLPDTELLIVGHHGSRSSTDPEYLSAVQAENAIISVGRNNSYGHPNRETLIHLQAAGCRIYRTDRNGTIEVRVKKG